MGKMDAGRLAALNSGAEPARNLAECLAVDQAALARNSLPALGFGTAAEAVAQVAQAGKPLGISRQMATIAEAAIGVLTALPERSAVIDAMAAHPSDTVRSWGAFAAGRIDPDIPLAARLEAMRRFAADGHFGVREWAWLAVRPYIARDVAGAIGILVSWTADPDPNIRRFAVESTRPRGVWCEHLKILKENPGLAEPLLTPLNADPARYVQDSVANWLNDASKSQPRWVVRLCDDWRAQSDSGSTRRIIERALRTLRKKPVPA